MKIFDIAPWIILFQNKHGATHLFYKVGSKSRELVGAIKLRDRWEIMVESELQQGFFGNQKQVDVLLVRSNTLTSILENG